MVSKSNVKSGSMHYVLEIWLIVWVDVVNLDATCLVILKIPDDLIGIGLAPVARFACSVGDAAQRAAVVVGAYVGGLVDCFLTDSSSAIARHGIRVGKTMKVCLPVVFM